MLQALLLVTALCIDAFMASLAYGTDSIRIPWYSALIINLVSTAFLGASLCAATALQQFVSVHICKAISFTALFLLGCSSLFQNGIKSFLRRRNNNKSFAFKYADIGFVIDVYLDETEADRDHSKVLSPKEALYFAVAVSIDSLVSGLGAGLYAARPILMLALCFVIGMAAVLLGCLIGRKLAGRVRWNISWLSGAILILLAVMRVV